TGVQFPACVLPPAGGDYVLVNLQATGLRLVCLDASCTFGVQFAITTFGQRSHPDVPAEFDVDIDLDGNGTIDVIVFNSDIGFATTGTFSGQNGVFVYDATNRRATGPYAYTIADLDSANVVFTVPLSALSTSTGLHMAVNAPFVYLVGAFDNYFT